MHLMKRNLELKTRCADLERARLAAEQAGARRQGVLVQIDTYFHAQEGRLKLRQIEGAPAELIWYARDNQTDTRLSRYIVAPVADVPAMIEALSQALGIRGVVRKHRTLYLFHNVRIHLDQVERLGSFIEFEAVISTPADEQPSRQRLDLLACALQIREEDRIALSYSDLAGF
jgi:predicted adenylyl cyclase CyaB